MRIKYQGSYKYISIRECFDIYFGKSRFEGDDFDYLFSITFMGRAFTWYIYRGKP